MAKTIAAVSTARGVGGIGTVRISGDDAIIIADKIFKSVSGEKLCGLKGYTARYGSVFDKGGSIDDAVALVFRAPHSYTGENTVEITVHGGNFVTDKLLRAVLDAGAVLAEGGEFTKRAFLNGKIDLSEAEAVMGIISAGGEKELRASRAAAEGKITKELGVIKEKLLFAAATVTAFTDFPDEEPEFSGIDQLPKLLSEVKEKLDKMILNYDKGRVFREGIKTAIIGSTNVGKSTLMNLLLGDERSIVTDIAGTTRDVVEETVNLGDVKLSLSDTAGMRETDDIVEKIGVEKSKKAMDTASLIIFVIDSARRITDEEKRLLDEVKNRNLIIVLNKTDIAEKTPDLDFGGIPTVKMSAKQGIGKEELEKAVREITGANSLDGSETAFISERQRNCAVRAQKELGEGVKILEEGLTVDAVGTCIDSALEAIMELTGERVTDGVSNEVFKNFCVGK